MLGKVVQSVLDDVRGTSGRLLSRIFPAATRGQGLYQFLYLALLVSLISGFVNALAFPVGNQTYLLYPSGGAETIPEAILDAFVIATGAGGVYLTYISGRQTVKSRAVNLYLGLALLLISVSILAGMDLAILKGLG